MLQSPVSCLIINMVESKQNWSCGIRAVSGSKSFPVSQQEGSGTSEGGALTAIDNVLEPIDMQLCLFIAEPGDCCILHIKQPNVCKLCNARRCRPSHWEQAWPQSYTRHNTMQQRTN